ncbi:MAG: hypothetical protein MJ139_00485 [Limosilactobacillus sp.]|nr:hypothetical protein [Limosilactobacillus sp.]
MLTILLIIAIILGWKVFKFSLRLLGWCLLLMLGWWLFKSAIIIGLFIVGGFIIALSSWSN